MFLLKWTVNVTEQDWRSLINTLFNEVNTYKGTKVCLAYVAEEGGIFAACARVSVLQPQQRELPKPTCCLCLHQENYTEE